jgi:serine/threonine protein kinase
MPPPQQAKDVFLQALEIAVPAERAAFLDAACAEDDGLRQRVEALLAAHERPESLLDRAAVAVVGGATLSHPATPAPFEGPGSRVGPYLLLEPLGEGGMGTVFLAEQSAPVRRRVALKVIKPGMDTAQVVARFEAERQALALMDHPNIAKVFDAGATPSGRPYFVMERVDGVPITRYCDDHRLSPRERLELFIPVCQAVQHAHQKGIIHRDLKPSNVLVAEVDGKPAPKVIDFGVAKAVDPGMTGRTAVTIAGALVGTPEYMSPEQAGAGPDVDTRTDVYGLGVLLYELLTGTTPIDRETLGRAALDEVLRRVREEEPPSPSTRLSGTGDRLPSVAAVRATEPARLARLVRGDLDWVVMKALEKDRARRYETAIGLARDLQRYLDGDPVEAGPPSRVYRMRKFARKHRVGLAAAGAVVLALVVAISALTVSTVVVSRGRSEALRELERVRASRRQLVDIFFDVSNVIGPTLHQIRLGDFDRKAWDSKERAINEYAISFEESMGAQLASDPSARFEAARCFYSSADQLGGTGRLARAEANQRKAVALLESLIAAEPGRREYQEALRAALAHLGIVVYGQRRPSEAEAIFRRALAEGERFGTSAYGSNDGKEWPAAATWTLRAHRLLGHIVMARDPVEAEALLRRAVALGSDREAVRKHYSRWKNPIDPAFYEFQVRNGVAEGQRADLDLIQFLTRVGKRDDAARCYRALGREDLDDPLVCNDVAWFLATWPDPQFRDPTRAVELARQALKKAPTTGGYWNTLGVALYRTGAWDESIKALTRSMELTRGDSPHDWLFLAMAHWQKGDRAQARAWYDKAVAWLDQNRPDGELTRFRAEAEALLRPGNPDCAMPSGPDAFVP